MIATLQCTVIDCPDPAALAAFYGRILGWRVDDSDPEWATLTAEDGRRLAFQLAPGHQPPRWPDPAHPQQIHLDFDVDTIKDAERAQQELIELGATFLHDSGGERSGFRVFNDPAGHPFCICYGQSGQS
ncbi:VOC family protein [Streptomyces sp. PSAA01]|uniref:VOC family protein n=1 Tax=Streptomyces sp. PSAA01 TaxID=2912762 RepID=UPI001F235797|nr:VOC family protein [Streptomyces sp. PSAA01]MCG0285138.1 VOC family protein [Streptomyces sp. PSAA01]